MRTLCDVLERVREERLDVSAGFLLNLRLALTKFERRNGAVAVEDLKPAHVRDMMRMMMDAKLSPRTINNYRASILFLWRAARDFEWEAPRFDREDMRKLKEPQAFPTAWKPDQFNSLVAACKDTPMGRGWGPDHWLALVLTVYDTSLRVGCLLKSERSQLNPEDCTLSVPGELQKGRCETRQPLHRETYQRLVMLPRYGSTRLFPWPFHRDELWRKFREQILLPAGLPATRRDLFHKIRRTSYTLVAKAFGLQAASEHAAHRQDMSRNYLDRSMIDRANPLDALPRPGMN